MDWGILFDKRYAGRIEMLDDIQEDFAPALKVLGYSINDRDPRQLERAAELLRAQRKIIRGYFSSKEIYDHLLDHSVYVAFLYSGDTLEAASKDPDIEYVVPSSGRRSGSAVGSSPRRQRIRRLRKPLSTTS